VIQFGHMKRLFFFCSLILCLLCVGSVAAVAPAPNTAQRMAEKISGQMARVVPTIYAKGERPETHAERAIRWAMAAEMAAEVAVGSDYTPFPPEVRLALIMTIWQHESAFDWGVHGADPTPIGDSDGGRARCMGQIHRVPSWWTQEQWEALAGRSRAATARCAEAVLRVIDYHVKRCRLKKPGKHPTLRIVRRIFGSYGDGHSCMSKKTSRPRGVTYLRYMLRLNK